MIYSLSIDHKMCIAPMANITLPYFYIHGRLEDEAGYDVCMGTIEELYDCLKLGLHVTTVIDYKSKTTDALVCKYIDLDGLRTVGLVVALNDTEEAIGYCLDKLNLKELRSIYFHDMKNLQKDHPNVWKLIQHKIAEHEI